MSEPSTVEAPARPAASSRPRVFRRLPDGTVATGLDEAAVATALASGDGELWVDIDVRSPE